MIRILTVAMGNSRIFKKRVCLLIRGTLSLNNIRLSDLTCRTTQCHSILSPFLTPFELTEEPRNVTFTEKIHISYAYILNHAGKFVRIPFGFGLHFGIGP